MWDLKIIDCEQGTPEWHLARSGKFTGSEADYLIYEEGVYKSGDKKGQEKPVPVSFIKLVEEKASEDEFGVSQYEIDTKVGRCTYNDYIPSIGIDGKYGKLMEADAFDYYQQKYSEEVFSVGFVLYDKYPEHVGTSPDGLNRFKNSGLELKCPTTLRIHRRHLRLKSALDLKNFDSQKYWQVIHNMLVCKADSWDFVSYMPFLAPEKVMSCLVITKDEVQEDLILLEKQIDKAVKLKLELK